MAQELTGPTAPQGPDGPPPEAPAHGAPPEGPAAAGSTIPPADPLIAAELPDAAASPPARQPAAPAREPGHLGVALLLATASIITAIVGTRVSLLSSEASGSWQTALRLEVKRSAGAQEIVRYLYQDELAAAIDVIRGRVTLQQLQSAAAGQTGSAKQTLEIEMSVQTEMLRALDRPALELTKAAYALPSGGVDLGKRLADLRASEPIQLAIDPDASEAAGVKAA